MKRSLLYGLAVICLATACNPSQEAEQVTKAYERLVTAILTNDVQVLKKIAPALTIGEGEKAQEALKNILQQKPSYRVQLINLENAEVILADSKGTVIPFRKIKNGEWILADQITRIKIIDFIPRREKNE
ncbi:MAG: hypothetical protein SNJ78_03140 [Spirochaetales bacterium]